MTSLLNFWHAVNSLHNFWYLFSAYAATWAIHGAYLTILARKYSKLRREMESHKKSG